MDRRTYFKQLLLASSGMVIAPNLLLSCKNETEIILEGIHQIEPLATFEQMRNAVRQAKGHLAQEMERVLAKKEAKAIFEFVQNRFMTIPASENSIYNAVYDTRWGQKGLLRCGKGTMREKSDLLFFMLQKAGFNPNYFRGSFPLTNKALNYVFCSEKLENDSIEVSKKYLNKWNAVLTDNKETETIEIDKSQEKSKALAEEILAKLPANASDKIEHFDWLNSFNKELQTIESLEVPIVQINHNGKTKNLNLFENKTFEEFTGENSGLRDLSYTENKNKKITKVRAIVQMQTATNLGYPTELVRGEWELQDLIGKQIAIQFSPSMTLKQQLLSTPEQINSFIPFLTLRDPNLSNKERKNQSFSGLGFDMMGNTFKSTKKGVEVNGVVLDKSEKDTSEIKSIAGKISAGQYPKIELLLSPKDANGNIVYGLPASAFLVKDNNEQVVPVLTSNFKNPRVLVLMDASSSMPFYRTELSYQENATIINAFEKQYQKPIIDFETFSGDFVEIFQKTDLTRYDYIMIVNDSDDFVDFKEKDIQWLQDLVKNVAVSYHFVENMYQNEQHKDKMKAIFHKENQFFEWKNFEKNITTIVAQVNPNETFPYALIYQPTEKAKEKGAVHQVEISVTGKSTAKPIHLKYELDEAVVYEDYNFPCGLTLELQWQDGFVDRSITKTLVGFDERIDNPSDFGKLKNYNQQLKSFAFGSHFICFEGDKPTLPALLDDLLSANLTVAPLLESNSNDLDKNLELFSAMQPLPNECLTVFTGIKQPFSKDVITFENGFQSCIFSEYYDAVKKQSVSKIDMLETSDIRTFAPSKKEAFKRTLEQTAYLAISEAENFSGSSYSDLKNADLKLFTASETEQKLPLYSVFYYEKSDYQHILYDASQKSKSYWQINKYSGAILGMLPDGSGGGKNTKAEEYKRAVKIVEILDNTVSKVFGGGTMLGIVQMYSVLMADLWAITALIMNDVGVGEMDAMKSVKGVLVNHAKGAAKNYGKKLFKAFLSAFKK